MTAKKSAKKPARKRSRSKPVAAMIPGELLRMEPPRIEDQLGAGTKARLLAFCSAHFDASPSSVVHQAVEDFIKADLEKNGEVKRRFDTNGV